MSQASTTFLQGLVERLQAGDPSARAELINHSCARLRRLARRLFQDYRRLQPFVDADDVAQNASLRLMQALQNVFPATVAEFFGLAARHMRLELLDLVRRHFGPEGSGANRAALPDRESGFRPYDLPQSTDEPERLAEWTRLHEVVETLPALEREVFGLLWYHRMTQAEAAAVLHVSVPTIKRHWLSARLLIRDAMHGEIPGR